MARTVLTWSGMAEFQATLRALPAACATEAEHAIEAEANAAAVEIKTAYPYRTGNLRRGVVVTRTFRTRDGTVTGAAVESGAPHAHLYEYGTKDRVYTTKVNGVPHRTGPSRAHDVFNPAIERAGARMTQALKAIVRRLGATLGVAQVA